MELFLNWLMIASIALAGAMSPGPDFVVTVRNSIVHSRKAGVMTGLGICVGLCVHMTYCVLGIAVLIAQSQILFSAIKYAGAAYLLYVGYKCLRSEGYSDTADVDQSGVEKNTLSAMAAFKSGLLTNLLNPKATMFFLALFTQVIDPHTPFTILMLYAATIVILGFGWWLFVALVLTHKSIKTIFLGFSKWIDRVCGGLMLALGLKLALSKVTP